MAATFEQQPDPLKCNSPVTALHYCFKDPFTPLPANPRGVLELYSISNATLEIQTFIYRAAAPYLFIANQNLHRQHFELNKVASNLLSVTKPLDNELSKIWESKLLKTIAYTGDSSGSQISAAVSSSTIRFFPFSLREGTQPTIASISANESFLQFLTDYNQREATLFSYDYLAFFNSTGGTAPVKLIIKKYNSNNTLLATNDVTLGVLDKNSCYTFPTGGSQLRGILGANFLNNVAYYTVQIDNKTPLVRYEVKDICRGTSQNLRWVNNYGAWEGKEFTLKSKQTTEVQKDKYLKSPYNYNQATGVYSYDASKTISRAYNIEATDTYALDSDWTTEVEYNRMRGLILSPVVQMLIGNEWVQVNVLDNAYTQKQIEYDSLFNFQIKVERAERERIFTP